MLRGALFFALVGAVTASPPLPSLPTTVYVHYLFSDLEGPDATSNEFYADVYISTAWQAPGLAAFAAVQASFDSTGNFTPMLEISNARDGIGVASALPWACWWGFPSWITSDTTTEAPGSTWVNCQTRVAGMFSSDFDVHSFPQDEQFEFIEVQSSAYTSDKVVLVPVADLRDKALPDDLNVLGWNRKDVTVVSSTKTFEAWNQEFSIVAVAIKLQRDSGYYMNRVVTNIILLMFMAFFFSFLNADDPIRLLGNLTVFATIVAWVFVILLNVPTVSYQTRLDSFLIASFACIFAMAILHGCNYVYFAGFVKKEEAEERKEKEEEMRTGIELAEAVAAARANPRSARGGENAAPPLAEGGARDETGAVKRRSAAAEASHGAAEYETTTHSDAARPPSLPWHAKVERGVFVSVHRVLHPRTPVPPNHVALRFRDDGRGKPSHWDHVKNFTKTVMTPDRKADVFGTLLIAVVYAIAVAAIFGRDADPATLSV